MVKLYYAKITNLYDEKCFEEKIKQVKEKRQVRIFEYCQKKRSLPESGSVFAFKDGIGARRYLL